MTMLKPKKPQSDDGPQNAGRVRLPEEQGIRPNKGIRDLLEQAREKQGTQFELPWTTSQPGQSFILTVKWDKGMNDPIWTLYEETPGDSRIVWSQPFAPSDMDFMYDVLSMSAGSTAVADKSALADLKPTAEQLAAQEEQMAMDKANGGKIKHGQTPAPAKPEPCTGAPTCGTGSRSTSATRLSAPTGARLSPARSAHSAWLHVSVSTHGAPRATPRHRCPTSTPPRCHTRSHLPRPFRLRNHRNNNIRPQRHRFGIMVVLHKVRQLARLPHFNRASIRPPTAVPRSPWKWTCATSVREYCSAPLLTEAGLITEPTLGGSS